MRVDQSVGDSSNHLIETQRGLSTILIIGHKIINLVVELGSPWVHFI